MSNDNEAYGSSSKAKQINDPNFLEVNTLDEPVMETIVNLI